MLHVLPLDYKFSAPARLVMFLLTFSLFFSKSSLEGFVYCLPCFDNINHQTDVFFSPLENRTFLHLPKKTTAHLLCVAAGLLGMNS
jgi:hypothetical protein